jgi:S-adenosylmethionine:tRNA ribosyltransferase-isomerase
VAIAKVRASKTPGKNSVIYLQGDCRATVTGRDEEFFQLEFSQPLEDVLESIGGMPLPPYLEREAEPADLERYQTVYARHDGAVAAPTAGLHFDTEMMRQTLEAGARHAYVTLHVGAGTFQNLREEEVSGNRLHSERVRVSPGACEAVRETRRRGGRVIAVGTTSVRALEAAAHAGSLQSFDGETDLFILPGHEFRMIDAMVTNFHLPRSSLLMLVAAFAGRDRILAAYRHAVSQGYRFFSYGDAMLVFPETAPSRVPGL